MDDKALRQHVINLLKGGSAHASFDDAVRDLPAKLRGKRPKGAEHSPWEVLEHMRLAQSDILEFSRDPKHVSPDFPEGYWPKTPAPPSDAAWKKSIAAFRADHKAMMDLVADPAADLFARIPHGEPHHTLLREALVLADHNAYHLGELVLLRRLLGAWKA